MAKPANSGEPGELHNKNGVSSQTMNHFFTGIQITVPNQRITKIPKQRIGAG